MDRVDEKTYEEMIPENAKAIMLHTFQVFERKWFENLSLNLPLIRKERDVKDIEKFSGEPALVIAGGRSAKELGHLELIRKNRAGFRLLVCDRMVRECIDMEPDLIVTVDGSDEVSNFYREVDLGKSRVALSVFTSPKVVENMSGGVRYWFIPPIDNPMSQVSLTRAVYWMCGRKTILVSLGNVGAMCWNLAYFLGCNPIGLVGMDYGYGETDRIEDTVYFKAYKELCRGDMDKVARCFRKVMNPLGRKVLVDLNWDVYRYIFLEFASKAKVETYNLSPVSSLFGENVKYMEIGDFLGRWKK